MGPRLIVMIWNALATAEPYQIQVISDVVPEVSAGKGFAYRWGWKRRDPVN